jgi:uncharacterized RDD family membrane protein YckC
MADSEHLVGNATKDRFFAAICDNFVALVAALVAGSAVGTLGDPVPNVVVFVSYFAYYFLCEGLLSTTPGKFVCGLSVRGLSGKRCTWLQAAIRTLLRLVEVNPILLGALPAGLAVLATKRHQRLGDLLAGTVVVPRSEAPPASGGTGP